MSFLMNLKSQNKEQPSELCSELSSSPISLPQPILSPVSLNKNQPQQLNDVFDFNSPPNNSTLPTMSDQHVSDEQVSLPSESDIVGSSEK